MKVIKVIKRIISFAAIVWGIFIVLVLAIVIRQGGLGRPLQPHSGMRPTDYEPAKWISTTHDIWFEVYKASRNNPDYKKAKGEISVGDTKFPIVVNFGSEENISFEYYNRNSEERYIELVIGQGIYTPDTMIMRVSGKEGVFFRGETIEFVKE